MSIESFNRSLHGVCDADPLLIRLRAISKVEDPSQVFGAAGKPDPDGWPEWTSSAQAASELS
ncbi:MAG: hypothetical protein ABJC13_01950 [Acidobacteriota bacterium]